MSSPAGHALLQGGKRSTYTGREVRQEPVWLARDEPGSRVMAKGLAMSALLRQQTVLEDVLVRHRLNPGDGVDARVLSEQVGEALLWFQVAPHRGAFADFQPRRHYPALGLKYRE